MEHLNMLSGRIIGAAIEVHRYLGPGLLESAYEECLNYELVENLVVVELKTVDVLLPVHDAQILTYMKFAGKKLGLLINFNVTLLKNGLRRFIF